MEQVRYYGVRPFLALYDWPDPAGYFIRRAIEDKADRYALANRRAVPSLVDCPDAKPLALPGGGL